MKDGTSGNNVPPPESGCILCIALWGTVILLATGHYGGWIFLLLLVPIFWGYGQDSGASWLSRQEDREQQHQEAQRHREEELRCRFTATELRYFEILGVGPGASFAEIKKGYHKRCLQYHPDTVAHLGEEFKRVADGKMKEINGAYDYFEKKFK